MYSTSEIQRHRREMQSNPATAGTGSKYGNTPKPYEARERTTAASNPAKGVKRTHHVQSSTT